MSRLGDPLIGDFRLAKVERMVRLAVPTLPRETTFVTAVLERGPVRLNGEVVEDFEELCAFILVTPNPKRSDVSQMNHSIVPISMWRRWEREYDYKVGQPDPAIEAFVHPAREHAKLIANLRHAA